MGTKHKPPYDIKRIYKSIDVEKTLRNTGYLEMFLFEKFRQAQHKDILHSIKSIRIILFIMQKKCRWGWNNPIEKSTIGHISKLCPMVLQIVEMHAHALLA